MRRIIAFQAILRSQRGEISLGEVASLLDEYACQQRLLVCNSQTTCKSGISLEQSIRFLRSNDDKHCRVFVCVKNTKNEQASARLSSTHLAFVKPYNFWSE